MKKLKKILLINWLYFSKELIEVDDINFLTGKNAAGKSTIIDALQIVLVGETNARNFNQAANEKSQRTLDGYLRADMDENNPNSRRAKDFSSFIACEFWDDTEGKQFVCGIIFDCRSDGSRTDRFFIYDGALPEDSFVRQGEAIDIPTLRVFLKTYGTHGKLYDTHEQYQKDLLAKWNVHNKQVMRMMKKAISFRPIVDIQKFITENICDIPEKPDIQAMQQNIRDYKRHEQLAQRQEEKLEALRDISRRYRDWQQAIERWRIQSFLSQWAKKEVQKASIQRSELERQDCKTALAKTEEKALELNDEITQKETRKRELELAVAQSDVYKEQEKLFNQKQHCILESQRLTAGLENLGQNIRLEATRVSDLCEKISTWDEREELERVKQTALKAEKAYAALQKGGIELFSRSLALFERAQTATAEFSGAIRDAAHKVEDRFEQHKTEADQKRVALDNLRKNIKDYLHVLEIKKKIKEIKEQISNLNLFWLEEQRRNIGYLREEIDSLRSQHKNTVERQGQLKEQIRQLEYERLPALYQELSSLEDALNEEFSQEYQEKVGIPRYEQELYRLKRAAIIQKNFSNQLIRTKNEMGLAERNLFQARREYADRFKPCPFRVDAADNEEYEAEQRTLEESELPKYREKIKAARESALEQFQNDFLSKLKSSIDQVQEQVKNLNKALKQAKFGTDQYQFKAERNPDYADYYDMIMAPELMEGKGGLFALPFQQKYGKLIETMFSQIAMSDDTQANSRKQSELLQNIERFTDFRTYLKFDLETTDQNGSKQLLSQTLNTKSGGETQTPFYIAVLASFAQLYQVNNPSILASNTMRLVVFDEAFNKMDSDRIIESVRLLRKMGLQAIICTPPDKLPDIMPLADRTHLVIKEKYQMHTKAWGKEILPA